MSDATAIAPPAPEAAPEKKLSGFRRQGRRVGSAIIARGEPMLWLTGGGLVVCLLMVIGLLGLVLWQGITTFWPVPVIQVRTVSEQTLMGEITREDVYELSYGSLTTLSGRNLEAAGKLLHPQLHAQISGLVASNSLDSKIEALATKAQQRLVRQFELLPASRDAAATERSEFLSQLQAKADAQTATLASRFTTDVKAAVDADKDGNALFATWTTMNQSRDAILGSGNLEQLQTALDSADDSLYPVWGSEIFAGLTSGTSVSMRRRLFRTGNFDLTGNDFNWVSDYELTGVEDAESTPEWALLLERLAWGRFYGFPKELRIEGEAVATEPAAIWEKFQPLHAECRQRWAERRGLEKYDTGEINRRLEHARLELREVELAHGVDSAEWTSANEAYLKQEAGLQAEFETIRENIVALDTLNANYTLVCSTADGQEKEIALADIVRVYPANRLGNGEKSSIYGSRWSEFLLDDPREANSEGGVFPAIFGTVIMTLLMSVAVVPFGVLAALYLREYAKAGPMVSTVRIAVNNLAGVPSIVFGVFGLGFFCYIIGSGVDELFYGAKLPNPTFGTGGLMWASLTLALLTLPVVIVATEEALAAVPRSMREGSLACGATKWQTIYRIVLPRAMPGIMTGMILAMARGAGEVAPLMLVGAVKLAPELCVDLHDLGGSLGFLPTGPLHAERSFMHLGFHIYDLGFQSRNSEAAKPMVYTTTLLLIGLIAGMNVLAIWLRARLRKKFQFSQM